MGTAKDLTPVAEFARVGVYLRVRHNGPINDFKVFGADLKANPGKRSWAASPRR